MREVWIPQSLGGPKQKYNKKKLVVLPTRSSQLRYVSRLHVATWRTSRAVLGLISPSCDGLVAQNRYAPSKHSPANE